MAQTVKHLIVPMLANRSFDHMLGFMRSIDCLDVDDLDARTRHAHCAAGTNRSAQPTLTSKAYGFGARPADASVRPEWLYEIVNAAQRHAHPRDIESFRRLLDAIPPESEIERGINVGIAARLRQTAHRGSHLIMDRPPTFEEHLTAGESPTLAACIAEAERLLRTECDAHWTVERIARRVGCNRTNLEAAFRRHGLRSLHGYLVLCRIDRAKQLLRSTAWRVEEIAKDVGYRSKTSLYKQFRRTTGMSPEEYRARWKHTPPNHVVLALLDRFDVPAT